MLQPPAIKLIQLTLLAIAAAMRALAWVLDPNGRRFGYAPERISRLMDNEALHRGPRSPVRQDRIEHRTLPVLTHFHIQRHCSYCGVMANLESRCDGCGSPPLATDTIVRHSFTSPQAKEHHHG